MYTLAPGTGYNWWKKNGKWDKNQLSNHQTRTWEKMSQKYKWNCDIQLHSISTGLVFDSTSARSQRCPGLMNSGIMMERLSENSKYQSCQAIEWAPRVPWGTSFVEELYSQRLDGDSRGLHWKLGAYSNSNLQMEPPSNWRPTVSACNSTLHGQKYSQGRH